MGNLQASLHRSRDQLTGSRSFQSADTVDVDNTPLGQRQWGYCQRTSLNSGGSVSADQLGITPAEISVAKQMGIKPEDFLKSKQQMTGGTAAGTEV